MARSRCLPPSLLDDPDYFELDGQTQAILIGLVLCADDHGRGMAHANWLGRKLNREICAIETALAQLQEHQLLQCYQIDQQRYYVLLKWWEWEAGLRNPARSKYPVPPQTSPDPEHTETSSTFSEKLQETLSNSEEGGIPSLEVEGEVERELEIEGEEEEEGQQRPSNVVTFPTSTRNGDDADGKNDKERITQITSQVAHILKVPEGEALSRIVQDYHADPSMSLLGEADAAREWIDDPQRNKKHKRMSLAFFRRWLQRERESRIRREAEQAAASQQMEGTGTTGKGAAPVSPGGGLASRRLDLDPYYQRSAKPKGSLS